MDVVRYGIIGAGQVALKAHIPDLMAIPSAEIVALCGIEPKGLEEARRMVGGPVRTCANYRDLIADKDVDVVVVATPNWLHKEQSVAAFEAGKHVFCEKPMGIDLAECDEILAAQKKNGKLLQIGHEMRYSDRLQTIWEEVQAGLIGSVQMMGISEMRFPLLPGWRQTGKTGGAMLEKNSHYFDLFNWFAGAPPTRVIGCGGNNVNKESPLIDHCTVVVEYENGVRGTLVMCLFAERDMKTTVDIVGDKGHLIACDDQQTLKYRSRREDVDDRQWCFGPRCDGAWHPGGRKQHEAFIRSVQEGTPILEDGIEGRKAVLVSLAAERAVAGETVVALHVE